MNIYLITWLMDDFAELSAIVSAEDRDDAIKKLSLDQEYNKNISTKLIGVCCYDQYKNQILCRESI